MQTSETELIARSLRKDADALGVLVERYKDAIFHHCYVIVHDEAVAEDMAQEAFIAAYYKMQTYDQDRKFSTWLFKIATNKCLTWLKTSKRTVHVEDEDMAKIVAVNVHTDTQAKNDEVHRAVERLQPNYRTVVSLYYWQGMDYLEIAQILNVPTGSVKGWMNRAKKQLRKELT